MHFKACFRKSKSQVTEFYKTTIRQAREKRRFPKPVARYNKAIPKQVLCILRYNKAVLGYIKGIFGYNKAISRQTEFFT